MVSMQWLSTYGAQWLLRELAPVFETGSLYVVQAGLKLPSLPSAGITEMYHQARFCTFVFKENIKRKVLEYRVGYVEKLCLHWADIVRSILAHLLEGI
jgi:hypothetical protein